jgi:hypothetical protein
MRSEIVDGKRRPVTLADADQLDIVFGCHFNASLIELGYRSFAAPLKAENHQQRHADRAKGYGGRNRADGEQGR